MAFGGGAPRLVAMHTDTIHPAVRVGHVHLRVADLDRAIAFYREALGLGLTADGRGAGIPAAFLAAGDYHHHIALNTFEPARRGLYHVALRYPDRDELARAVRRLIDHDWPVAHASDHGATVSVYLADADGNGIELYYDRPRVDWFDTDGQPVLKLEPFDPRELLDTNTETGA